ncbi:MAG: hotdog fold thioesterase [Myxococcales bacterium]
MSSETKELRVIGQGRYLEVVDENGWEYVRRHGATGVVVIVATTDDRKLVLVEQARVPVHRRTIELPAGLVGDQTETRAESLEAAAIRELQEETGFRAEHWNLLVEGPTAVGVSAEVATFFRATGLTRVGPGGGDDSEDIVVHVIPLRDVPSFLSQKVAAGLLIDPKVFAALYFINTERPERSQAHSAAPPGQPFSLKLNEEQGPLPFVPRAASDGTVIWEYTVSTEHYNPFASLHGGVVMALLDSAMGHAVAAKVHGEGRFNAAAQMNVNFLVPVREGLLRARARVVKIGKRLAVVEAWAETADGTAVATATATHSLLP